MNKPLIILLVILLLFPIFMSAQDIKIRSNYYGELLSKEVMYRELRKLDFEIAGSAALSVGGIALTGLGIYGLYEMSQLSYEVGDLDMFDLIYFEFYALGIMASAGAIILGIPTSIISSKNMFDSIKVKKILQLRITQFHSVSYLNRPSLGIEISIPFN